MRAADGVQPPPAGRTLHGPGLGIDRQDTDLPVHRETIGQPPVRIGSARGFPCHHSISSFIPEIGGVAGPDPADVINAVG